MAANSAVEVADLQLRNHSTTAYSTLNCVSKPLFPNFDAQRALNCATDEALGKGLTYGDFGNFEPLVAQPPILGYAPISEIISGNGVVTNVNIAANPAVSAWNVSRRSRFSTKMMNSLKGSLYDLKHWDKLAPVKGGASRVNTMNYIMTRDDRLSYLILWIIVIALLITFISLLITVGVKKGKEKVARQIREAIEEQIPIRQFQPQNVPSYNEAFRGGYPRRRHY